MKQRQPRKANSEIRKACSVLATMDRDDPCDVHLLRADSLGVTDENQRLILVTSKPEVILAILEALKLYDEIPKAS